MDLEGVSSSKSYSSYPIRIKDAGFITAPILKFIPLPSCMRSSLNSKDCIPLF